MRQVRISATMRIAIGLVFLCTTVLLAALVTGLLPDVRRPAIEGRKQLCEAIAVATSVHASDYEFDRMKTVLGHIAGRNSDILSVAVRRTSGDLITEIGDHRNHWRAGGTSFEQFVVPIVTSSQERWGFVEIRFRPITGQPAGIAGTLDRPFVRLFLFVPAASLILFFIYLGKMLRHMDPSKVVPARVRTAMDNLAGGLLIVNQDKRIALANEAFAEHMNTTTDDLVGKSIEALPWKQLEGRTETPWTDAFQTSSPQIGLTTSLCCSAEQKTFVTNCTPIFGHDGMVRGVLASFEDVTELEKKKVELKESKDEADRANAAKSEFLARMSHEIRTPMNAILGFTDVLRRGFDESEEDREEYLNTIHSSGQYLLEIINDILDLSKVESGKLEVEQIRCSPHNIIQDVLQVLRVKADQQGIQLAYEPADDVPESIISDPVRLRQILTNLVGNAIKFTEEGSVRIVCRLERHAVQPKLAIDVIDTGIGMSAAALEKVFEPFAQADTSTTRRFGGTGLGLSISLRLAESLGGDVSVSSEEHKGSVFSVRVATGPLEDVRLLTAEQAMSRKRASDQRDSSSLASLPLDSARVLVVDDGPSNRRLVALYLKRAGATVDTAENGEEALSQVERQNYNAILMDMQMPVMDGITATRRLRGLGCVTPIIALTANVMKDDEQECREAGFTGFLTKPVDMLQLIEMVCAKIGSASESLANEIHEIDALRLENGEASQRADDELELEQELNELVNEVEKMANDCGTLDPIFSSLPTDDSEFREIVEDFVNRLDAKIAEMRDAWAEQDFEELAELGHWLKGAGPTVGFEAFGTPARTLEDAARKGDADCASVGLTEIEQIVSRIQLAPAS